jgi:hypothetical protein
VNRTKNIERAVVALGVFCGEPPTTLGLGLWCWTKYLEWSVFATVLLLKLAHPASCVNYFLLTRIKWMTRGTDFNVQIPPHG